MLAVKFTGMDKMPEYCVERASKMFDKLYGKKIDCQEIKQALIDFRKNHQIHKRRPK